MVSLHAHGGERSKGKPTRSYPTVALSRTAELNPSPVRRKRRTQMKGRKKGMKGEALLPAREVRREETSNPHLLDLRTAVHKVGKRNRSAGQLYHQTTL